jgi:hypothetical protein
VRCEPVQDSYSLKTPISRKIVRSWQQAEKLKAKIGDHFHVNQLYASTGIRVRFHGMLELEGIEGRRAGRTKKQ